MKPYILTAEGAAALAREADIAHDPLRDRCREFAARRSAKERRRLAVHEAGHVIAAALVGAEAPLLIDMVGSSDFAARVRSYRSDPYTMRYVARSLAGVAAERLDGGGGRFATGHGDREDAVRALMVQAGSRSRAERALAAARAETESMLRPVWPLVEVLADLCMTNEIVPRTVLLSIFQRVGAHRVDAVETRLRATIIGGEA